MPRTFHWVGVPSAHPAGLRRTSCAEIRARVSGAPPILHAKFTNRQYCEPAPRIRAPGYSVLRPAPFGRLSEKLLVASMGFDDRWEPWDVSGLCEPVSARARPAAADIAGCVSNVCSIELKPWAGRRCRAASRSPQVVMVTLGDE